MKLDKDNKMFALDVNGINFMDLPYKYDLAPEGDFSVICTASVKLNAKYIVIPNPWINRKFVNNL